MKNNNINSAVLLMVFMLLCFVVNAQDRHLDTLYSFQPALMTNDLDNVTNLTGGGSFIRNNPKAAVTDEVMLYPGWQQGIVNFKNGKQLSNVELKFNLLKNEVYFNNNGRLNLFVDTVKSFSIFDTSNHLLKVATFSNGYPRLGTLKNNTYYLVLTSGARVHLLKYIYKRKQDIYEYSAPTKTVYTIAEELLVYDVKNNVLKSIKNNAASLEKALPDYTATIQQQLKEKSGKSLTDEEILDVMKSINNAQ